MVINEERCRGCELCVVFCRQGALEIAEHLNSDGLHPAIQAHPELCRGCAMCAMICPHVAIVEVYRDVKAG